MTATALQGELTTQLLHKLEDSRFLHEQLMNRVEQRIRTKDELERYVSILMRKLEETNYRSEMLLNRVERLLKRLERLNDAPH